MNVLVPVDGSECSVRAVEFAAEFADRFDADLHVVHLTDAETDAARTVRDRAREALGDGADATVEIVVREMATPTANRVGREILDYATETDADHVVMGHHDSGRVERAILGSAAETVVRAETIPVTVIP